MTSNVEPKDLAARLGDRVISRLAEMCQRVPMKGHDRRRVA
jgi:DNA replication protein DnaC